MAWDLVLYTNRVEIDIFFNDLYKNQLCGFVPQHQMPFTPPLLIQIIFRHFYSSSKNLPENQAAKNLTVSKYFSTVLFLKPLFEN